ncbi:MAG: hypothetical protein HUJ26_23270 [Planctomycetaceae bacterium]|nr:hypothetical protein [Planctomycetaceae bacterium]
MSLRTRRTVFQLTPLLDLLLIVIFAQYMDVRQAGARQEVWFEKEAGQLEAAAVAQAEKEAGLRQQAEIQLAVAEKQLKDLQEKQGMTADLLEDMKTQRKLMAEMLTQSLKIDPQIIAELMDNARDETTFDATLRQTLQELSQASQAEAVSLATSYHELLKRCDIWDFRLELAEVTPGKIAANAAGATIVFSFGEHHQQFAINLKDGAVITKKEFEKTITEIKNYLKSLPQPKGIVIVISGFLNEDTSFGLRTDYKALIQKLLDELTLESAGQTRFYYRELGYLGDLENDSPTKARD